MRRLLLIVTLLFSFLQMQAQEKRKFFGAGVQLGYSDVYWRGAGVQSDSLNALDKGIGGLSGAVWYLIDWKRYSSIQVGLQYTTTGFCRHIDDVQYRKSYHPDLPVITDNYQGSNRQLDFMYRTHYIGIPIYWNREITRFKKSVSLHYFFTPGISLGFRIYDKTIAKTSGFRFDGKDRFVLNNIYQTNPLNIQLHLAGRVEYLINARYRANFQPVINLPLIPNFKGQNKALVPSVGMNLFITMLPKKDVADSK